MPTTPLPTTIHARPDERAEDSPAAARATEAPATEPTIFDALGGEAALELAVALLCQKILDEDELAPYFGDVELKRHARYLQAFLTGALGGPDAYRGRSMTAAHAHLGLTDRHFDLVASCLVAVLDELGVDDALAGRVLGAVAPLRESIVSAPAS